MMMVIDSFGWIAYLSDGPLADKFEKYLSDLSKVITPAVVTYEVYKKVKQTLSEEKALWVVGQMAKTRLVPLNLDLALSAAEISIRYALPMADAIVYATAVSEKCPVVTSDPHFKDLEGVIFISRSKDSRSIENGARRP